MKKKETDMEKLSIINHPEFGQIRSLLIKGEPWFIAKDICDVLGIKNSNDSVGKVLDTDEAGIAKIYTRSENGVNQLREVQIITESGLYALIMRSNKPGAKPFRKWVTGEVLPAIRKYGFYIHPSAELSNKDRNRLYKQMLGEIKHYIIEEDKRRCGKRLGVSVGYIESVMLGRSTDNDVMRDLQERAMSNRENWADAYHPRRMMDVVKVLKR